MKKLLFLLIATLLFSSYSFAKPFYIGIRIGFFAKTQVVTGDCIDGLGVCISFGNSTTPDNAQLGYDAVTADLFYLRIPVKSSQLKFNPGEDFELKEDSPIDPRLIKKLESFKNPSNKVVYLKKGTYPLRIEGDNYIIAIKYSLQ